MVNHPNRARKELIEQRVEAEMQAETAKNIESFREQLRAAETEIMKYVRYLAAMSTQRDMIEQALVTYCADLAS